MILDLINEIPKSAKNGYSFLFHLQANSITGLKNDNASKYTSHSI